MINQPLRLAVWSGPRNISTALMRSWGSRPDTIVVDEPFYAHYLMKVDTNHPGRDEVIAHHETDVNKVIASLLAPLPDGKTIFYQKHMNKHTLPGMDMSWTEQVTNCFLIREPKEMITSFIKVVPNLSLDEFGLLEQVELFKHLRQTTGENPIVVDSKEILMNPRSVLSKWCEALRIPFVEDMLSWEPGIRDSDGIWAKYWYDNVAKSTGFAPYKSKNDEVPEQWKDLLSQCVALYDELYPYRIH